MSTPTLKIKVTPTPKIKGKMDVRFPANVEALSPILLDKTGGSYTFSFDMDAVTGAIGFNYQPLDSDLSAIAALSTTAYGRSFLTLADAAAAAALAGIRERLTANRAYYVRKDGSDSNTGLANTSGGAFLTIAKALAVGAALDASIYNVTIRVGAGTWTVPISLPNMLGSGVFTLVGDIATPSNVTISTAGSAIIADNTNTVWTVDGFKVATSSSGYGIYVSRGARLNYQRMDFGACAVAHVAVDLNAFATATGNTTISGNSLIHWYVASKGGIMDAGKTITLTGTPAFSNAFAQVGDLGVLQVNNNTFSGSATGIRYSVSMNGVIDVNGGGASYLPGSSAGSASTGGQYN